jgi:hypothetical protein
MNNKKIPGFLLACLLTAANVFADDVSYDRYASLYADREEPSLMSKVANDFLTYPFELIRWPVNQALIFAENRRVLDKGQYIYEKILDYGITPYIGLRRYGAEIDFIRLSRQKVRFPDLTLKGWYDHYEGNTFAGGRIGMERILDTPFRTFTSIQYSDRPEEHFYGIGPDTSKGEGTSYNMEQTILDVTAGYSKDPSLSVDTKFFYKNTNITNGEDGGRGIIDTTFPDTQYFIPGLKGDEVLGGAIDFVRDTRNHQSSSTRGMLLRGGYSYNEGLGSSDARYLKLVLELSKYLQLGSERRVLVTHFYFEDNHALSGHQVPFWDMARLGGYGNHPSLSRTLRGYDDNRYYDRSAALLNVEYRYTVYEYRDFKMDTVLFWDSGQVFRKLSRMQFQDFKNSFGGGFRFSLLNHVIFSVEAAHGNEGTSLYVKNRAPF